MHTRLIFVIVSAINALSAASSAEFSTFLGDTSNYQVARIQTDPAGNTYVAGSRNIAASGLEVFVMKLDSSGKITLL